MLVFVPAAINVTVYILTMYPYANSLKPFSSSPQSSLLQNNFYLH